MFYFNEIAPNSIIHQFNAFANDIAKLENLGAWVQGGWIVLNPQTQGIHIGGTAEKVHEIFYTYIEQLQHCSNAMMTTLDCIGFYDLHQIPENVATIYLVMFRRFLEKDLNELSEEFRLFLLKYALLQSNVKDIIKILDSLTHTNEVRSFINSWHEKIEQILDSLIEEDQEADFTRIFDRLLECQPSNFMFTRSYLKNKENPFKNIQEILLKKMGKAIAIYQEGAILGEHQAYLSYQKKVYRLKIIQQSEFPITSLRRTVYHLIDQELEPTFARPEVYIVYFQPTLEQIRDNFIDKKFLRIRKYFEKDKNDPIFKLIIKRYGIPDDCLKEYFFDSIQKDQYLENHLLAIVKKIGQHDASVGLAFYHLGKRIDRFDWIKLALDCCPSLIPSLSNKESLELFDLNWPCAYSLMKGGWNPTLFEEEIQKLKLVFVAWENGEFKDFDEVPSQEEQANFIELLSNYLKCARNSILENERNGSLPV